MDSNIFNNPLFQNLSPEKLKFLMEFQNAQKPTQSTQAGNFFTNTMQQAQKEGIQFSKEESSLLIDLLMQNMSDQERQKAQLLMMLLKKR